MVIISIQGMYGILALFIINLLKNSALTDVFKLEKRTMTDKTPSRRLLTKKIML